MIISDNAPTYYDSGVLFPIITYIVQWNVCFADDDAMHILTDIENKVNRSNLGRPQQSLLDHRAIIEARKEE